MMWLGKRIVLLITLLQKLTVLLTFFAFSCHSKFQYIHLFLHTLENPWVLVALLTIDNEANHQNQNKNHCTNWEANDQLFGECSKVLCVSILQVSNSVCTITTHNHLKVQDINQTMNVIKVKKTMMLFTHLQRPQVCSKIKDFHTLTTTKGRSLLLIGAGCSFGGRHVSWDRDNDVTLQDSAPIRTSTSISCAALSRFLPLIVR